MAQDLTKKVIEVRWPSLQMTVEGNAVVLWDDTVMVGVLTNNGRGCAEVSYFNPAYDQHRDVTRQRVYQQLTESGLWTGKPVSLRNEGIVKC